ncbi:NAD(P)-dependent oxidoreductase [Chloracidobacterium validum]|uniref:NAD(P)-dependent oxidoreductase n=1 Tax=Chloracidobacterium validum TaxID=2821543 RepID=A0ABX8B8H1_9BACT|nr:NAD(P)-dependent oxidoreductase [Chloracidobacterium validum]QUW01850.1 NAD(P)-dependent oxidoreductase [Chloracidobacterium validum]
MMDWLVTGGTGYLGTHLVTLLGATPAGRRVQSGLFEPRLADLLRSHRCIVHLAAHVSKSADAAMTCFEINSDGTRWLCAQLTAGQTLILASTKDVYGAHAENHTCVSEACPTTLNGQSAYAWSKWLAEEYARFYAAQRGFRLFILRLSTIFAPPTPGNPGGLVSSFARAIRAGQPLTLRWQGQQVRDLLPVSELARVIRACAASSLTSETFNIGGGSGYALTFAELAHRIGQSQGYIPQLNLTDAEPSPDDQRRYVSDLTRAGDKLGWAPGFDLDAALAQA